ncbi:hypothetical protein ANN_18582 [Periplaneta americana]|uniref:DUF4817 domain-containing protein n=1 Tax=Periplaneta americana TaxID=6978 RepID=A0ABQ8SP66_PERAM|nr:hypothetical protein ANN_18582 [Periplaneta americana]
MRRGRAVKQQTCEPIVLKYSRCIMAVMFVNLGHLTKRHNNRSAALLGFALGSKANYISVPLGLAAVPQPRCHEPSGEPTVRNVITEHLNQASVRQHSLKWVTGKQCIVIYPSCSRKRERLYPPAATDAPQCGLLSAETKFVKHVQRQFRREYNLQRHDPIPGYKRIMAWDAKLKQTGSLLSSSGKYTKERVSEENSELVRTSFIRSPRKSIRKASLQLQIPRSTVHNFMLYDLSDKQVVIQC